MNPAILIDEKEFKAFCISNHIRKAVLFGSYATGEQADASDIDILVEFEEGWLPGLHFFSIEESLGNLLKKNVDLNTLAFLAPDIRENVYKKGIILYAA